MSKLKHFCLKRLTG